MKKLTKIANEKMIGVAISVRTVLLDKRGESTVGQAITILVSVVLGALLLAGLYKLFGDVIIPQLRDRIQDMFNYAG